MPMYKMKVWTISKEGLSPYKAGASIFHNNHLQKKDEGLLLSSFFII